MMVAREYISERIIGTSRELEGHIDNMLYLFDKNVSALKQKRLLDIGCGSGERTIRIAKYFDIHRHNTHGVDYNNRQIEACKKMFNAEVIDLESDGLPFCDNYFDLVVCNQVLEHLKNYRKVIDDMIRVTRERGYIVIGVPNLAHLINRIYLLFGIQPMCIHLNSSHVRAFTHKAFVGMLNSLSQVKLIDYAGAVMYPLPYCIARKLSGYFAGLSGYVCYLLQKTN